MILTVTQYRELTGQATAPPSDAAITTALTRYSALIEGFCGRYFGSATRNETHYAVGAGPLQLKVFPITEITALTVNGESRDWTLYDTDKPAGMILHGGAFTNCTVAVSYSGGYQEAPQEVKVATATLVQAFLAGTHGGVESLSPGRKEVVAGVGSIDYGNSAQQLAAFGTPYAELGPYTSVLEKYREPGLA